MRFRIPFLTSLGLLAALLAACSLPQKTAAPTPTSPPPAQTPTPPPPTPSPTPEPRLLTICLGQEPGTLYPYGGSSRAQWSVLEALYDGPFDNLNFTAQPVILKKMPAFVDGDAVLQVVDVKAGDSVLNTAGEPAVLAAGVEVLPAGCTGLSCAVTWDGSAPLQMDQLALTYSLLPGVTWSDGAPLTAADSVYSFNLASDPASPVNRQVVDRTDTYQALDDLSVAWKGLPGYVPQRYETNFFLPLPRHAWEQHSAADLLTLEASARRPLGWGPYVIDEWVAGDHLTLRKNPAYFRAAEGLPKFDVLTYRFLGEAADNNLAALLVGECDVVDRTSLLDQQLEEVVELQQAGKLKLYVSQGPEWEHLDFGIRPAAYDDPASLAAARPDFFGDLRVRQALAKCIDRQGFIEESLFGQSSVPASYLAPGHPLLPADLAPMPYDPEGGKALLDEAGWKDLDGDPKTPRSAAGTLNVPDGTALSLDFVTTSAPLRVAAAKNIAAGLADCGVQVSVRYLAPQELYAAGPQGVLFGRNFDLALFSWEAGYLPPCQLYESDQIPNAANNWLTTNITGFRSSEFDAACKAARTARPDQAELFSEQHAAAQRLFASLIPSLPLYYRLELAASRPDLCGMSIDPSARSGLWNLESFDYGTGCTP